MVYIKSKKDIEQIKKAVEIWKIIRSELIAKTKAGISLIELNNIANQIAIENNATMAFYKYQNFPGHICISVNHELIHGVPSDYVIKPSDMISFDVGVNYNDYICDAAFTVLVEPISIEASKINDATYKCLMQCIEQIRPGNYTGDIGNSIYECAKKHGYEVIKPYSGHGCGIMIHEDPSIPNYGEKKTGYKLKPGMIICIEPMLMTDSDKFTISKKNGWTVMAKNKKLTCHWEHMILITDDGYEILTA